jgi:SAM-dependent methyltransferase
MTRPRLDRSVGRRFFGEAPETYDAARPGHAKEVYEILRERCGVHVGSHVLEIGPGTGQATRKLLELGADPLVAIEPDPALAEYVRALFDDRVEVRETALEESELEPHAYDLAAAASSFHWVEEAAALAKLRAALRDGGWIALWWTTYGDATRPDPFRRAVDELFEDVPDGPSQPARKGGPSFALDTEARLGALRRARFQEQRAECFRWSWGWDAAGIRNLYSTFSPLSALEPGRREQLLDAVERIAADEFGDRVERPLVTSLYTARNPA